MSMLTQRSIATYTYWCVTEICHILVVCRSIGSFCEAASIRFPSSLSVHLQFGWLSVAYCFHTWCVIFASESVNFILYFWVYNLKLQQYGKQNGRKYRRKSYQLKYISNDRFEMVFEHTAIKFASFAADYTFCTTSSTIDVLCWK